MHNGIYIFIAKWIYISDFRLYNKEDEDVEEDVAEIEEDLEEVIILLIYKRFYFSYSHIFNGTYALLYDFVHFTN